MITCYIRKEKNLYPITITGVHSRHLILSTKQQNNKTLDSNRFHCVNKLKMGISKEVAQNDYANSELINVKQQTKFLLITRNSYQYYTIHLVDIKK